MSEISDHVTRVFEGYGYDYSGCMAIVDEIIHACETVGMTPEEFDNTHANYRTQYTIKPSGWRVFAKFRPRRSSGENVDQQARNHIFHWIEREGWRAGLKIIYDGVCGDKPRKLAELWGLDIEDPEYAGLPENWQRYFELLHSGNMYAAYIFMAQSMIGDSDRWQRLADQAEANPALALNSQPYLKRLVEDGEVALVSLPCEKRNKRKWIVPSRNERGKKHDDEPARGPGEFLF